MEADELALTDDDERQRSGNCTQNGEMLDELLRELELQNCGNSTQKGRMELDELRDELATHVQHCP